jgi:prepilin signal peptidase PulO-like enzyme (type II secretory pathway)
MFYSPGWRSALLGGLVGATFLIIPVLVYGSERAGIGDGKLGLFVGLVLGFPRVIYAFIISFIVAAIFAVIGIASGKLNRKSTIPFAPFLASGTLVCFVLHFAA